VLTFNVSEVVRVFLNTADVAQSFSTHWVRPTSAKSFD